MSPDRLTEAIPIARDWIGRDVFITRQGITSIYIRNKDIVFISVIGVPYSYESKFGLNKTLDIINNGAEL